MARIELPCPVCGANVVHSFPDYFNDTSIECHTRGCAFAIAVNGGTCACSSQEDDIRQHYRYALNLYRKHMQDQKWLAKHEHEITIEEKTMTKNRTEEDWFLRGGERPSKPEQLPPPPAEIKICEICGGSNISEDDETDDDEREFEVTMSRYRTVKQEARVTVKADCEESAMEKAEELAEDKGDEWDWKDVGGSEEIEDVGAEEAEEL